MHAYYSDPFEAFLSEEMRAIVKNLSEKHFTAVVTGRKMEVIKDFMKLGAALLLVFVWEPYTDISRRQTFITLVTIHKNRW